MDPALITSLIAAGVGGVSAFVAYWAGVGATEKRLKAREDALLDDLDDAIGLLIAARESRHPAGRHLRLVTREGA